MITTVPAIELKNALHKVISVIDRKNSRPVLTNLLFQIKNKEISIIGSDLELSIKTVIPCQHTEDFSFCVNAKHFSEIIRELPDDLVEIKYLNKDQSLSIKCGNAVFSLHISTSEEYPTFNFISNQNAFKISKNNLIEIINKLHHAISFDETRIFFNGIFLQKTPSALRAVATDGYQLALLDIEDNLINNEPLINGIIIPRKGIVEMKRMAESEQDSELNISTDGNFLFINNAKDYFLNMRLIARDYPKYQSVIPSKTNFKLEVESEQLLKAAKRIKIMSSEKTNGVKIKIENEVLTILSNHPDLGDAVETLPVKFSGATFEFGMNAKYLIDLLSILGNCHLIMEFQTELTPVVFKAEEYPAFLAIIMPLRL